MPTLPAMQLDHRQLSGRLRCVILVAASVALGRSPQAERRSRLKRSLLPNSTPPDSFCNLILWSLVPTDFDLKFRTASSAATKDVTQLFFHLQLNSPTPVNRQNRWRSPLVFVFI